MTDDELERRLRAWYRADVDGADAAPGDLRTSVAAIPRSSPGPLRLVGGRRNLTFLAAVLVLVVGGGLSAGGRLQLRGTVIPPEPSRLHLAAQPPSPSSDGPVSVAPTATPSGDLAPGFSWTSTPAGGDRTPVETAVLLADGRVLVMGECATAAQLYDVVARTFSTTGSLSTKRFGKTATLLADGRVLVTGGFDCVSAGQEGIAASAEIYDPATGTFTPTGAMKAGREFHTATLLGDGRVLITGGLAGPAATRTGGIVLASVTTADSSTGVLASAELFDPATGTFHTTGSMSAIRDHHTATLLPGGKVLVVGGGGEGYASSKSADLYDPATGTFQRTGSMRQGRWLHTASLLPDGRVLVLGGRSPQDSVYRTAEMYDPRSGTFSSAGSTREGRQQHTTTVLPDGRVFIAGGLWSDGHDWRVLSTTEMFDPSVGTFTSIGSMGDARFGHTATLLRDGRVLIVGGSDIGPSGSVPVTSAVLYEP
jgi:hypothetical protein